MAGVPGSRRSSIGKATAPVLLEWRPNNRKTGFFSESHSWSPIYCGGSPMAALPLMAGLAVQPMVRAQDLPALEPMLRDVERMEVGSNPERREVLMEILSERGIEFELEAFNIEPRVNYPRRVGANIVVTLGDGPADIVIGAHFDAVWLMGGTLGRGAVDNAASSIVLTRLASMLGAETLRHRIRIVFFDMEEIGLVGSRNYVRRHGSEGIAAAINLDVNGYGDTLIFGPTAAEGNTALPESMREVCTEHDFQCMEYPRFPNSDYLSFQAAGIPNISFSCPAAIRSRRIANFLQWNRNRDTGFGTVAGGSRSDSYGRGQVGSCRSRGDGDRLPCRACAGAQAGFLGGIIWPWQVTHVQRSSDGSSCGRPCTLCCFLSPRSGTKFPTT